MKMNLANIDGYLEAASASAVTVGTGNKTFILAKDVMFFAGDTCVADDGAGNTMSGTIVSYDSPTKKLILNVAVTGGSGSHSSWTVYATHTFRFASKGGKAGGFRSNRVEWEPRLNEPGSYSVNISQSQITGGIADVGAGIVEVENTDKVLDFMKPYAFDGRPLTILSGEETADYPLGWDVEFTGTMQGREIDYKKFRFLLRDRQAEVMTKKVQGTRLGITDNTYAGTNSAGNGVEGVNDLKGKPKPVCYGEVFNIEPPCVNTSKFIYQVNWRAVQSIPAVYSGGVALGVGTSRASLALLQSNVPSAGTFDYYLGSSTEGAYFRLDTDLQTNITADVVEGANSAARTIAQVAKRILVDLGEVDAGDITSADITAVDSDIAAVVGIWVGTDDAEVGDMLQQITQSGLVNFWLSPVGMWRFAQLKAPSGTPAAYVEEWMIKDNGQKVQIIAPNDDNKGIPPYQIKLGYQKNYTIQNATDVFDAGLVRLNFTTDETRTAVSNAAGVQRRNPLSIPKIFTTLITTLAAAQTEADRRRDLLKVERETVQVVLDLDVAPRFELNDVVRLTVPRYDWSEGKDFRLVGILNEFRRKQVTLTLWG